MRMDWDEVSAKPLPFVVMVIAFMAVSLSFRFLSRSDIPHLNPRAPLEFSDARSKQQFVSGARGMLAKWFASNPDKPVRVIADYGEVTVLPPGMANEIRNDERLSFSSWVFDAFHAHLPGFEGFREGSRESHILQSVILRDLTKQLSKSPSRVLKRDWKNNSPQDKVTEPLTEETTLALSEAFTENPEWHRISIRQAVLPLVARISSRVFLGDSVCRNEDWLKVTREYTVDASRAAEKLRLWPSALRPIVHWFVPECQRARAHVHEARRVITPILEQRRQEKASAKARGEVLEYSDAIEWLEQAAAGRYYDPVNAQLVLSLAAIHTTTDLISQVLTDLAQHPDIIEPLRQEAISALAANGWTKASLYNMKLLDSVIKESQRLKPIGSASMRRVALSKVTLADGTTIPKGSYVAVSAHKMWDEETHEKADQWDGYRFFRRRQIPGEEHSAQLVNTGPDHLGFGHGQHACPGRFFAANEVKIALVHILLKYDWRLPEGVVPKPRAFGFSLVADPTASVDIRRRVGVDI